MSIKRKGRTLIKSRVSDIGHERIFVKKKATFIICIISLLLIGVIFYGIHLNQLKEEAKKEAEEKRELELLYYDQNTAFALCYEPEKRFFYHGTEDGDKNQFIVNIYAYNNAQSEHELSIDEFIDYISEEYDSEGKPKIYSQPSNVKEYIHWYYTDGQKGKVVHDYSIWFGAHLLSKGISSYREMSYEEVIANLEEFQKDPEYNPFIEG